MTSNGCNVQKINVLWTAFNWRCLAPRENWTDFRDLLVFPNRCTAAPEKIGIQDVAPKIMQFRAWPRFPIATPYKLGEKPG